jgi:predicted Fe-S protein YdhL (DUF1289 family)
MGESVTLLKLTRIEYDDGSVIWVEMRPETAEIIRRLDESAKRRETRRKAREKTFSEMGMDEGKIRGGNPWEGPRLRFRWLVGESRTWDGEAVGSWIPGLPQFCRICYGAELPAHAYCLGCDRTGRDEVIGSWRRREEYQAKVAKFRPKGKS